MLEWIARAVEAGGYLGVALLMLLENVFPPIPSELVMPMAGYAAAQADGPSLIGVILAGSVGSLAGAYFWYVVGAWIGAGGVKRFAAKRGRLLTLTPKEVGKAEAWFERYGHWAVLFGRLVPAVRTLISVPAGAAGMSKRRFLVYSSAGTLAWTALLAVAGYGLGDNYELVEAWLSPVSNVVVASIVAVYLYRVATFRRKVPKPGRG